MTDRDLPNGWELVRLGDICTEERVGISSSDPDYPQTPYLGLEHVESNTGRILVTEDEARYSQAKSNNFRFTSDHVLYGKLRPYLNKVALPHFAGRCTTEIFPLQPTRADREWLAWFLRLDSTVEYAMKGKTGSRMPRASMKDLMKIEVALPPFEEQRRRIQRLNGHLVNINEARTAIDAQIAALEAMPTALLRKFFPRSRSAILNRGTRWVRLGDICEVRKGRTPKRAWYADKGLWLVRFRDLSDNGVSWSAGQGTYVDSSHSTELVHLLPGTLLITADAHDPRSIGKKVVYVPQIPVHASPAHYSGEMLGIRALNEDPTLGPFIGYWFASEGGYEEIQEHVSGSHLNAGPARQMRVPLPNPDRRAAIVANLDRAFTATTTCTATLQARSVDITALNLAAMRLAFAP